MLNWCRRVWKTGFGTRSSAAFGSNTISKASHSPFSIKSICDGLLKCFEKSDYSHCRLKFAVADFECSLKRFPLFGRELCEAQKVNHVKLITHQFGRALFVGWRPFNGESKGVEEPQLVRRLSGIDRGPGWMRALNLHSKWTNLSSARTEFGRLT